MSRGFLYRNGVPGSYPQSYYAATANAIEPFATLDGDAECDVCIVGGGFTGLSAALELAERGLAVLLLEAHRAGWGASGRNGGQAGSGQRRDQTWLERVVGRADAHRMWEIAQAAKALVRDRVARHAIDCDLKPGILHADHKPGFVAHSHAYAEKLRADYGYADIRAVDEAEMREMLGSPLYYGGWLDMGAAHLHPLNFALGLADAARTAGAHIFERSPAISVAGGDPAVVRTARGQVRARFVILACNGYLDGLSPQVAARVMPINNFVIATEPLGAKRARQIIRDDVAVADSKFVINYFRLSADRRLLFGGGETYSYDFPRDIKTFVRPYMLHVYPQLADARIDYGWGGTLGITLQRLPYFARLQANVLTACGYSGHGVALATLAGQILAEAVAGTMSRFDLMARLPVSPFPGGTMLRHPLLVLAMLWYGLRDRL
ncbi:MAG: FAD-binding oxidoreductase [Rhodospirillales bacterium]|nr:MAG: FAD-binding oxidoreductase [Rhodospirillales bacterium]